MLKLIANKRRGRHRDQTLRT